MLDELGMENLEEKLQDAVQYPAQKQYRLGTLLSEKMPLVCSRSFSTFWKSCVGNLKACLRRQNRRQVLITVAHLNGDHYMQ